MARLGGSQVGSWIGSNVKHQVGATRVLKLGERLTFYETELITKPECMRSPREGELLKTISSSVARLAALPSTPVSLR